jgi:hypothetical protein
MDVTDAFQRESKALQESPGGKQMRSWDVPRRPYLAHSRRGLG